MDFSLSEDQQAIADLATQILDDKASHEIQRDLEKRKGLRFDRELWSALADAGLLGIAVPDAQSGAGLGFLELAAILEQMGRHTAPVPFYETALLAGLPLARFGTEGQRAKWLPKLAAGEVIATAALLEQTATAARRDGDGFVLTGVKLCVPAGELADLVLVPASLDGSPEIFLLDPKAPGVTLEPIETTSGMPESRLALDGARVDADALLGGAGRGAEALAWTELHATAGLCLLTLGCCEAALEITSEYIKTRKQFDQPISMFQAVGHRAADAYIDTEAIRLTTWQAAWRLSEGLPSDKQVAVAKFWCAEGAKRVVHAALHLHGGVGVDREYPLHRFFLHARHLELALGGATEQLVKLGAQLAAEVA